MRDSLKRITGLLLFFGSLMLLSPVVSVVKGQYTSWSGGPVSNPILLPNGAIGSPALGWASAPTRGWYYATAADCWGSGATNYFCLYGNGTGLGINATSPLFWYASGGGGSQGTQLFQDAANTLALRNSTAAQTFNIYNTADGSPGTNYERGSLKWDTNILKLSTENGGTGSARSINIVASTAIWQFSTNGKLYPADDSYGIGGTAYDDVRRLGILGLNQGIVGYESKTLTDGAAAASIVRIAVPQTVGINFAGGDMIWTARAADATPHTQSLSGRLTFTAVNNAGTEVCTVNPTAAVTAPNANSSGTLACTLSCASAAADTVDIQATCDTSFGTPTALTIYYRLDMPQPNTVTPQ